MPKGRHNNKGHTSRESSSAKKKDRAVREALRKERRAGNYLDPSDPEFLGFRNQLESQGLRLHDVPGDGNCLFRAVVDQLRDGHSSHRAVRREVVRYMREHKEEFAPFVEDDVTFEDHISDLAKDGVYAGNDVIVAFAKAYGVNVVIHQSQGVSPQGLSGAARSHGSGEGRVRPTVQQVVAHSTGCKDMELVEQCIRENAGDPDLAIVELLQLMDLSADCKEETTVDGGDLPLGGMVGGNKSRGASQPEREGKRPQQAQRHLSNRERKEQAKAARKERRAEEQRAQSKEKTRKPDYDPVGAMAI